MNYITLYNRMNRCMKFNYTNLGPVIFPFLSDIIDMIIFNQTECTAEMTDNPCLSTIENSVVSHDMASDIIFTPTIIYRSKNNLLLSLMTHFCEKGCPFILSSTFFFTNANPNISGITYNVIFNYPTLTPMWPNQSFLHGGRRCPLCGCLFHGESSHCNIVKARLFWEEAGTTCINFYISVSGICPLKIRINCCLMIIDF